MTDYTTDEHSDARPIQELFDELDKSRELREKREASSILWRIGYKLQYLYWWILRIDLRYECKKIYWFFQRGFRGWSDRDVWGLDGYLSDTLVGTLKHLKKHKQGYPGILGDENFGSGMQKWDEILDHMIWTFETAQKVINLDVCLWEFSVSDEKNEEYRQSMTSIKRKGYEPPVFLSKEETKKYEAGFDLLRQYFFGLWD
jgi:hypothetical protein